MDLPWNTRLTRFSAPPGDPNFFSAILNYIQDTSPELPMDYVILRGLLLCLMAGNKHLLLRTTEEDISVVQNMVYLLFTKVLGYTTYKHRLRRSSRLSPPSYISSLFFPEKNPGPSVNTASTFKLRARRSRSVPTSDTTSPSEIDVDSNTQSSRRRRRRAESSSKTTRPSLQGLEFHSEPVTAATVQSMQERLPQARPRSDASLPQALVLSGLENATVPCQRALWQTLQSKIVALDYPHGNDTFSWSLPDDFIVVYVCPLDPHERPAIHKGLLDQFSISANVELRDNTRQAYMSYLASILPQTLSPALPQPILPTTPIIPPEVVAALQELCTPTHVFIAPSLHIYLADLFSAARHHHELDGSLLTSRAMREAETFVRAHRVIGGGDAGISLVQETALMEELAAVRLRSDSALESVSDRDVKVPVDDINAGSAPAGEQDIDDGLNVRVQLHWQDTDALSHRSGLSPSPLLQSMRGSPRLGQGPSSLSVARSASLHERRWWNLDPRVRFYVSEIDVAKIVPRVITHRLRVRTGPEDEVFSSVMFPAVKRHFEPPGGETKDGEEVKMVWRRSTVRDIIVKLLAQV
ncbi:hypothetical protein DENSPDRAFT_837807 [Dentipellis sp. KUC8613]|nr:hypothetical protein DENSPDRAFT_837807 [Dentipellis sp. KUC8613]